MKRTIACLLIVTIMVVIAACGANGNDEIIGTWKSPEESNIIYCYTFRADETGEWWMSVSGGKTGGTFTYEYDSGNHRLVMTRTSGEIELFDVAVTADAMLLSTIHEGKVLMTTPLVKE